jgi:CBS domain containing-hemolysin-like protein
VEHDVTGWAIVASFALVLVNGVFVAFEFGLVAARRARLEALAEFGSRRARLALAALGDLSQQIAGVQLGITMASLGLGALAEPAVAHLLEGPLESLGLSTGAAEIVAFVVALSIVVFLHTLLGEMVPKYLAIAEAERALLWLAVPMRAFLFVFGPVVRLLDGVARAVMRLLRIPVRSDLEGVHTAGELALIVEESRERGVLDPEEHALLSSAIAFAARPVREVMVPRSRIVALSADAPVSEIEALLVRSGHSRLPVTRRGLDDVIGFLHAKDLLSISPTARGEPVPRRLLRRLLLVTADRPLEEVLVGMRRSRLHLALVRDRDGRTVGLVSLEDLLEEVVGEISDETDRPA